MEHSIYKRVVLTPASRDDAVDLPLRVGAFFECGSPIGHFCHRRRVLLSHFPDFLEPEIIIPERCIYGGLIFDQYGHFITETLSRYWFIRKHPRLPILWHRLNNRKNWLPWQAEILQTVGILDRTHIFIDTPVRIDEIFLPDPGFVLFGYAQREHCLALARYVSPRTVSSSKIWISRKNAKAHGDTINDNELEEMIQKSGWEIFEPEKHTVKEQLERLSTSARVAGIGGSAFHTLMLMRDVKASIRILPRFPYQMVNFDYVGNIRGFDQKGDSSLIERVSGEGSDAVVRLVSIPNAIDFIES